MQQVLDQLSKAQAWKDLTTLHKEAHEYYLETFRYGRLGDARLVCQQMLQATQADGDRLLTAHWLHELSVVRYRLADYQAAELACREGLTLAHEVDAPHLEAHFRHRLARIALDSGEHKAARQSFAKALVGKRRQNDRDGLIGVNQTPSQAADLVEGEGRLPQALTVQAQCMTRALQLTAPHDAIMIGWRIARLLRKLGQYKIAGRILKELLARSETENNLVLRAGPLVELSVMALLRKRNRLARQSLREVADTATNMSYQLLAEYTFALARFYQAQGDIDQARRIFGDGSQLTIPGIAAACTVRLAMLNLDTGDLARRQLYDGIRRCEALLMRTPQLYAPRYDLALAQLGLVTLEGGSIRTALNSYKRAVEFCGWSGIRDIACQDLLWLPMATGREEVLSLLKEARYGNRSTLIPSIVLPMRMESADQVPPAPQSVSFGKLLRRHRTAASLTQEDLADRALVSPATISACEKGRNPAGPHPSTIQRLAASLGLAGQRLTLFEDAARHHPISWEDVDVAEVLEE